MTPKQSWKILKAGKTDPQRLPPEASMSLHLNNAFCKRLQVLSSGSRRGKMIACKRQVWSRVTKTTFLQSVAEREDSSPPPWTWKIGIPLTYGNVPMILIQIGRPWQKRFIGLNYSFLGLPLFFVEKTWVMTHKHFLTQTFSNKNSRPQGNP